MKTIKDRANEAYFPHKYPTGHLDRMAELRGWQGHVTGQTEMLDAILEFLRKHECAIKSGGSECNCVGDSNAAADLIESHFTKKEAKDE